MKDPTFELLIYILFETVLPGPSELRTRGMLVRFGKGWIVDDFKAFAQIFKRVVSQTTLNDLLYYN